MPRTITNNVPRPLYSTFELTSAEREHLKKELNYLTQEEFDSTSVFKYREEWYSMDQFCRLDGDMLRQGWQGYFGETAWSSIIIKIVNSHTEVVVGRHICD